MQKYSTYKPSNVEWLGDVPSHWKVTRLINRTVRIVGGDWGDDPELESDEHVLLAVIRVQDIDYEYEIGDEKLTYRKIKASKIDHRLIDNKTLLIEKSGGGEKQLVGRVAIPKKIKMPAICSNFMEKIEMDEQAVPSFFNYIFHALYNRNMNFPFVQQTTGIQNLKSTYYFYTKVTYPNPAEQTAIAAYLDQATANIDKVIATKQKQLEKLEQYKQSKIHECVTKGLNPDVTLKPSGIDWIGDVPGHWKSKRFKDVFEMLDFRRIPLSSEERNKMEKRIYNYYGASGIIDKVEDYIFDEQTILIAEDGANLLSRSSRLVFIASGKYWVNNHAHVFKPRFGSLIYFAELLELNDFSPYVTGAAQPKLSYENLSKIKIVVPPTKEQFEIEEFLQEVVSKIEKEKSIIEQQIEKLKQYRKCLIHECVTGKRKVINEYL